MSPERVCAAADLPVGSVVAAQVNGVDVAVVHCEEGFFAVHDECSHGAVPLSEGEVDGCHLECYLHGSRFNLMTGIPDQLPATEPITTYPVLVAGDDLFVDVDRPNRTTLENNA